MTPNFIHIAYRIFMLGLQNFIRNTWLTFVAIIVMTIAIAFVVASFVFNTTSHNVIADFLQDLKISVYFEKNVSINDINNLEVILDNHPDVAGVEYVSTEAAQERFVLDYDENDDIQSALELLSDRQVFPASLEITAVDLNKIPAIKDVIEREEYQALIASHSLDKFDSQAAVGLAVSLQETLVRISFIMGMVFISVAFLIIFNTIRIAIFSRREEVQIMRLLGAPNNFIRNPFLVEAGLYGSVAGGLAVLLIYGLIWLFNGQIQAQPELMESYLYFTQNLRVIILILTGAVAGGVAVSLLSCAWAIQRYLRL